MLLYWLRVGWGWGYWKHTHTLTHTHIHTHTHTDTRARTHARTHYITHRCTRARTHTRTYYTTHTLHVTHTHARARSHTHTHTHEVFMTSLADHAFFTCRHKWYKQKHTQQDSPLFTFIVIFLFVVFSFAFFWFCFNNTTLIKYKHLQGLRLATQEGSLQVYNQSSSPQISTSDLFQCKKEKVHPPQLWQIFTATSCTF